MAVPAELPNRLMLTTAVVATGTVYWAEESATSVAAVELPDDVVVEVLLLSEVDAELPELEPPHAASVHASAHKVARSTTFVDMDASPSSCKFPRVHSSVEAK
jgi:hypothetical protein